MNALSDELPHVRDHITDAIVRSSASDPYTPLMAHTQLKMEQQLADSKSTSSGTFVLAATSIPKPTTGCAALTCAVCGKSGHLKCCTNPKRPPEHHVSHTWPECFSEDGGHAGQCEAVLLEKAEKRCTTGKPGAVATGKLGNIQYDQSGQVYLVDPKTNTVFALQDTPSATCAQPTREFAGLASDILIPELVSSLLGYDTDEYDTMYLDTSTLLTSLDWCCYSQPVNLAAVTYKVPNQHALTTIDLSVIPFFLDTGASVHISNCESGFYCLHPVTPHAVHGVGGTAVQAIGIRSIHLVVTKGIHITLDNVLFISGATVCLISVSALTSSLKCVAHFANSDCWVMSASGARILSGTLTARRLYAVSGCQFTAAHALMVTHAPTLETWHNHLGHVNYHAVANLAHHTLVTGMPLSSSPPPPSCEHCILGKQT